MYNSSKTVTETPQNDINRGEERAAPCKDNATKHLKPGSDHNKIATVTLKTNLKS